MLKRFVILFAAAVLLAAAPGLHAGATGQQPGAAASQSSSNKVHFEGCVFTESALTSTTPIIIPVGSTQSYVLTNIKAIAGSVSADEAAKNTYALTKADQEQMRSLYGKRVGVVGMVTPAAKRPNLEIVSIREISGGCPTMPSVSS